MERKTHSTTVEGNLRVNGEEYPPTYTPVKVTIRLVTNRHGNVMTKDIISFLPGFTAHNSIFRALYIKYQIKANEGMK